MQYSPLLENMMSCNRVLLPFCEITNLLVASRSLVTSVHHLWMLLLLLVFVSFRILQTCRFPYLAMEAHVTICSNFFIWQLYLVMSATLTQVRGVSGNHLSLRCKMKMHRACVVLKNLRCVTLDKMMLTSWWIKRRSVFPGFEQDMFSSFVTVLHVFSINTKYYMIRTSPRNTTKTALDFYKYCRPTR